MLRFLLSSQGRERLDDLSWDLPLVGPLYRDYLTAQFSLLMEKMLTTGIDAFQALRACSGIFSSPRVKTELAVVVEKVYQGHLLSEGLATATVLTPLTAPMVAVGEQTGKLGALFRRLHDFHEDNLTRRIETLLSLLEPFLIAAMGLMVALFLINLVGPMFQLFAVVGQ